MTILNVFVTRILNNKMQPKVSVIIPVFRVENFLNECLKSVVNQTLTDIEIIIVDEGEEDRCREIIDFYERHDKRIVAPHQRHGGYGKSCNFAFEIAKGEFIAIIESDDFIKSDMLEKMYNYAKLLDADVVKTPFYEYWSDGRNPRLCNFAPKLAASLPSNQIFSMKEFGQLLSYHPAIWSGLYKTSYLRSKSIKFVEAKGGAYVDQSFRVETLINTDRVAWLNEPFYFYRMDNEGSTVNNFNFKAMIARWTELHERIGEKNWHIYGQYLIREEYINSISRFFRFKATKNDLSNLKDNWAFTSNEVIKRSNLLSEREKLLILAFKNSPSKLYLKIKINNYLKKLDHLIFERVMNRISISSLTFLSAFGILTFLINANLGLLVFLLVVLLISIKIFYKFVKRFLKQ